METHTKTPLVKFLIIAAFACAAIFFFFGFYTVTVNETTVHTISGIDIINGKDLAKPASPAYIDALRLYKPRHFSTGIWALIALICAVAGIFVFINETGSSAFAATLAAGIGVASLTILKFVVTAAYNAGTEPQGVTISFQFAYQAALLAFIVAAVAGYACLSQKIRAMPKKERKKDRVIGSLSFPFIEHKN